MRVAEAALWGQGPTVLPQGPGQDPSGQDGRGKHLGTEPGGQCCPQAGCPQGAGGTNAWAQNGGGGSVAPSGRVSTGCPGAAGTKTPILRGLKQQKHVILRQKSDFRAGLRSQRFPGEAPSCLFQLPAPVSPGVLVCGCIALISVSVCTRPSSRAPVSSLCPLRFLYGHES